ncbi:MAG: glutamate--cysteine ligase, partial [Alphaproteobacteria bacterium]|nr:glutamate--cysteine ligase [Alphaproteobacteria bacterium]
DLIADWTEDEREAMRHDVPRMGLDTTHRSRTVRDIALEVLDIAREGLHRRARRDLAGEDETHFLDALFSIAGSGRTPAAELVEDYRTRWGGDIKRIYEEYSY